MNEHDNEHGYFRGLVTGIIIGAAAALLLAPKKGGELRHDLSESAAKLKEQAGKALSERGTDD